MSLLLVGCGSGSGNSGSGSRSGEDASVSRLFANRVIQYAPVPLSQMGQEFYQPELILGSPVPGNLHVVSLGFDPLASGQTGGMITVGFGTKEENFCAVNGEGDDLIVYENPLVYEEGTYNEVAYVEVSEDGQIFYRFPFQVNQTLPPRDPLRYQGLAGVLAAGDRFDLQTVIEAYGLPSRFRACQVRLIDVGTQIVDADTNYATSNGSGADFDAVEILHIQTQ